MKNLVFISLVSITLYALDTSRILEQLDSLSNEDRSLLLEKEIDSSYNPFDPAKIGVVEKKTSEDNKTLPVLEIGEPIKLQAIFDERIKIDGRWYDKNQSVNEYSIEEISENSVILKNGDKIKKLFIFEETILKAK